MKKVFYTSALLLFAVLLIVCFPTSSKADGSLSVTKWIVEAKLQDNGDLSIVEDISYDFSGDFNGVFRYISLDKTSGVENISVKEISGFDDIEYTLVDNAENGDENAFIVYKEQDKVVIKVFSPSENEKKTLRISYVVKNVAIKYNDIGELYYKFLGDENETPVENFTVNIQLPKDDVNNEVKVFAHGPLDGQISKRSNDTYTLYVEIVPANTFIEGRLLFPREFIPSSDNVVNKDNYTSILNEENSLYNKAREKAERKEALGNIFEKASIILSVIGIALFLTLQNFFRRKIETVNIKGYSSIPEDCTPAIAAHLNGIPISSKTIVATILDLFRKDYIKVESGNDYKKNKSAENDFIITKVRDADEYLLSHESHFMDWLICKMGNGESISTQQIENYSKLHSSEFITLHNEWQNKVREDAINKGYFDKTKGKYGVLLVISFIILLAVGILALVYNSLSGLMSIFVSTLLLTYGILLFYRYSDHGYVQHKKWKEFRKYMLELKKQSSIDDFTRYPIDISLIYALCLGIDNRILNKFNINTIDASGEFYNNNWLYWFFIFNNDRDNVFERSIGNSFGSISDSTSGGGFSSGGGGGAGGGGTGGF